MANEASKAMRRRWREDALGFFPWRKLFHGRMIDVGCGPDVIPLDDVVAFDLPRDANRLSSYYGAEFDLLHSSQSLEHMHDPRAALQEWIKVVKPGGHLVITVPSWELYEGMIWPSRTNPDHKSTWSMWQKGSPAPIHIYVPDLIRELQEQGHEVLHCRLVDDNYDYRIGTTKDQTWIEADGVEAFIELVLKKKP